MKALLATFAAAAALSSAAHAQTAPQTIAQPQTLTLRFHGVEQPRGAILAAVFDSAEAYAGRGRPVRAVRVDVAGHGAATAIQGLPTGRYAIKAFHDLDGDGEMDTNPFGMPTEPFAFSNDAPANMGPPAFEAAAFAVGVGATAHAIAIR